MSLKQKDYLPQLHNSILSTEAQHLFAIHSQGLLSICSTDTQLQNQYFPETQTFSLSLPR